MSDRAASGMTDEWQESTLGQFLSLQRGHDLTEPDRRTGSVPVFGSAGQNGFHDTALAKGPGIVVGRSGASFGQVHYSADDYWPHNTGLYVTDFRGNDPRFAFYLLKSLDFARYNSGSAQPSLNRNFIYPINLLVPSVEVQRAIAHILGTLDDKIELNRRMNETLEAMARALFTSWFVDFDPVRAKAEGRDPGLPAHLADLFPDSFEDSELGEIPKGWSISSLGEAATITKGRSYRSEELVESDTALVTLKSFARGGGYRPDGLKSFAGTYRPEQIVAPGEIVVACTDVTQAAEVIGRTAMVRGAGSYRTLVASLDTLIVRPVREGLSREFIYFIGRTDAFVAHTFAHTSGTTVLHLSKEAVPSFKYAQPPIGLVRAFDSMASASLSRIQELEEESESLAILRDTLLPKLISGELRLTDLSRFTDATI